MAEGKKRGRRSKRTRIPEEALEHLVEEILALGDPDLEVSHSGRFCYVWHAGQPLCRLAYRGEIEEWDFAIYKYSSQRYSSSEFLFPLSGRVGECVRKALDAYNLI